MLDWRVDSQRTESTGRNSVNRTCKNLREAGQLVAMLVHSRAYMGP